jgi:hypothetical protein
MTWAATQEYEQAIHEVRNTADIVGELFQRRPGVAWGMLLPATQMQVSILTEAGQVDDAVAVTDTAIGKLRPFDMPGGSAVIAELLILRAVLASDYLEDDRAALELVAEACHRYEKLCVANPVQYIGQLTQAETLLMYALNMLGRNEEAARVSRAAISRAELFGELTRPELGLRLRAKVLNARGRLHRADEQFTEALADLRQARAELRGATAIADDGNDDAEELDEEIAELENHLDAAPGMPSPMTEPAPEPEPDRETSRPPRPSRRPTRSRPCPPSPPA